MLKVRNPDIILYYRALSDAARQLKLLRNHRELHAGTPWELLLRNSLGIIKLPGMHRDASGLLVNIR